MIFQELNKLKRNSIMAAVILMAIGIVMVICPDMYVESLVNALGIIMLIAAVVMVLDFISSKKALINFIYLAIALVLAIVGALVLISEVNTLYAIAWIFGIFLIIFGLHSLLHAMAFARRSGRKAWGVLVVLSLLLVLFGLITICNPWWDTPGGLMTLTGWMIVFSAVVSALRLIWIWPVKGK